MVAADKAGLVTDGPELGVDVDYQLPTRTLTINFDGYESAKDGIAKHEVAVGNKPEYDDVMEFTVADIISQDVNGIGNVAPVNKKCNMLKPRCRYKYYIIPTYQYPDILACYNWVVTLLTLLNQYPYPGVMCMYIH